MSYSLSEGKPVLIYEVYLPKKMAYASKLAEVLDSFFTPQRLQDIPAVQTRLQEITPDSEKQRFIEWIVSTIKGYSIYEVDGGFSDGARLFDERTWVIRFILHDPMGQDGIRESFRTLSRDVIAHLVTRRFAEELGTEQEIWFLEYEHCRLRRWVQQTDSSA
ncbi:MAG: hypothetical protein AB1696_06130 [Planctomycetota bacterium]